MASIEANNATINSGCGSGANLGKLLQHFEGNNASGPCKGTVKSFSAPIGPIDRRLDSGAYSGKGTMSTSDSGTYRFSSNYRAEREDSNVYGTRLSFNAGVSRNANLSSAEFKRPKNIPGDNLRGADSSFKVKKGLINFKPKTLNTSCRAGNSPNVNNALRNIISNISPECLGTEKSFCADSDGQIHVNGSILNTGAFSGITD